MPLNLSALERRAGVVFNTGYQVQELTSQNRHMAMDSGLVTAPNSGILSLFTTFIDPKVIDVLVTPMRMAEAFQEVKRGDWLTQTAAFPVIEATGETSTYGDYNNNGFTGVNVNWPSRQPYHYQTFIRVGEREMEMAGAAKLDWVSAKQRAAVLTLNKFQNKTYLFGVAGLENYGYLNDPGLLPNITSEVWVKLNGEGVYESIRKLFQQLVEQTDGHIDRHAAMKLTLSPEMEVQLTKTNQYNVNVSDQLTKNFPNMEVISIPEMATSAGELVRLVVEEYEGQKTLDLGFTEKMRVHPMIQETSSWKQKRSQGSFGTVVYRPQFITSMLVS
ncbi:DUF2184 domain-containing protein [Xenorhabdus bovienii]|uniref:DUF2184 domain-containing protein n=1 Tax=Xenorhabdus bovienii TaxID=40576 RepID=A0AAJ1JAG2_XENBV|nr:DUF2184 domain-containing protein [Xenorhabdus bovienii]MDE1479969.1 DUF2184 domain-containing protein [Xenorhabdus bovienii]MDE9511666.1 DUF2184 domain-containing protein [Xenorhabdus bovienii]MDE9523308.1 DUF2184 domain-containing protein [Xenorhabdus bovienii]